MDSSTLLRRTPAGDSEVAVPANGLSITQRRILTSLDTPIRPFELPLEPPIEPARLQREVLRLAQAGLIVCEAATAEDAGAANAATLGGPDVRRLMRRAPMLLAVLAAVALVWAGVRFTGAPAPKEGQASKHATTKTAAPSASTPVATPEPPVIATRILRGDPTDRNRDATKDSRTPATSKPAASGAPPETVDAPAAAAPIARASPTATNAPSEPATANVRRADPDRRTETAPAPIGVD